MAKLDDLFDRAARGRPDARVIAIRGAREHNLKNVDLTIPRDQLVVFTGLSGSGKSSLAFDTIYAEGQRRYVEVALGLCAPVPGDDAEAGRRPDRRPLAGDLDRAEDHLEEPALDRRHRHRDLRLHAPALGARRHPLLARHRPADREPDRVSQMVDRVLELPEKTRLYLLAPVVRGRKGEYRKEIAEFQKKGFQRVKIDGEFYAIDEAPALDKKFKHDIDVVVDRIVVRADIARAARRIARDRARARRRHRRRSSTPTRRTRRASRSASPSRRSSPARSPASPSPRSSRGCSRSTTRSAPARPATASATRCASTRRSIVPDETADAEARRHRALGEVDLALLRPDARGASPGTTRFSTDASLGRPAGEGARRRSSTAPATKPIRFAYDDGLRAYEVKKPFEGVDPQPGAPLQGDRERLGARGDRAAS